MRVLSRLPVILAAVILPFSSAEAEGCPAGQTLDIPGTTEQRLQFLDQTMHEEAVRARIWTWGWGGTYAALTVGQAVPIPFLTDPGLRIDFIVGGISSLVGAVFVLALPLQVMSDSDAIRDAMAHRGGDPCSQLADAEKRLVASAADEDFGRSWLMHAGNVAFNVAMGLVLALAFHRPWSSWAVAAGTGLVVGEAMIFTQPGRLSDVVVRYRKGNLARRSSQFPLQLAMWATNTGSGVNVGIRF